MIIKWLPNLIIKHNTSISSILTWYTRWLLSNYISYIKLEINYKTRKIWPNQLMGISVWMSFRYVNTMDVWLYNFPPKVFGLMSILIYDINVNKMEVTPENRHAHWIKCLRCFYDYHWDDTSAGGLLVPQFTIRPIQSYYWNWQFLDKVINIKTKVLPLMYMWP